MCDPDCKRRYGKICVYIQPNLVTMVKVCYTFHSTIKINVTFHNFTWFGRAITIQIKYVLFSSHSASICFRLSLSLSLHPYSFCCHNIKIPEILCSRFISFHFMECSFNKMNCFGLVLLHFKSVHFNHNIFSFYLIRSHIHIQFLFENNPYHSNLCHFILSHYNILRNIRYMT